jgi:hypothetical protein
MSPVMDDLLVAEAKEKGLVALAYERIDAAKNAIDVIQYNPKSSRVNLTLIDPAIDALKEAKELLGAAINNNLNE